jgi:uncharacterized protein DUF6504
MNTRLSGRRVREPIVMAALQNGFFPKAFVWRGQRHDVRAVEACRTEVRRGWQGQVESHHFRVRTEGAVFELAQDLARDTWHLEAVWSAD